jgi:IS5 family transposase
MGAERLVALIQESLAVAKRTGAAKPADFSKVIVDTTVQPKAVAFPTDAKLTHRARERPVKLARKTGVELHQSHERVGKHALIAHHRYAHAKQFKRANRALKTIRTYLGRVTRDIVRKIRGDTELESAFASPLMLARRVRTAAASERKEGLFAARARGRMHRQRQGASALRVRRQSLDRHHAQSLQGRPVHRPRQGAARQPL